MWWWCIDNDLFICRFKISLMSKTILNLIPMILWQFDKTWWLYWVTQFVIDIQCINVLINKDEIVYLKNRKTSINEIESLILPIILKRFIIPKFSKIIIKIDIGYRIYSFIHFSSTSSSSLELSCMMSDSTFIICAVSKPNL